MVLSLAPTRFSDAGRMGEEEMVAQLKASGVNAVSAQAKFGPLAFRDLDEEAAVAKIQETGADAVIVMSLLDLQKETRWVPGSWSPPQYYSRFWPYYRFWWDRVYQPGYYETTQNYMFETNMYSLADRNLIYSAQSRTSNPGSTRRLAQQFSKGIVANMKEKGVV